MLRYDLFYKSFITRRMSDINRIHLFDELKELPTGSILHTASGLLTGYGSEVSVVPDGQQYDRYTQDKKVSAMFITRPPIEGDMLNPDVGTIKQFSAGVDKGIKKFRSSDPTNIYLVKNPNDLSFSAKFQNIIAHDPLFKALVTGIRGPMRMFNLILASLLNHAADMPDRDHFLVFNTDNIDLSKTDFNKSYKKYDRQGVKYSESNYYLIIMHILGYLHKDKTESMFEVVPDHVIPKINIVLVNGNKFIIYRLDLLKQMVDKTPAVLMTILSQLNTLKTPEPFVEAKPIEEKLVVVEAKEGERNTTGYKATPSEEESEEIAKTTVLEHDTEVLEDILMDSSLTDKQREYVSKVSNSYKTIKIGDKYIEELLKEPADEQLEGSDVETSVLTIPDPDMGKSSISNFATEYMDKAFKKDMVAQLVSFGKQGMFLVGLEEEDVSDTLTNAIKYRAIFKDKNGTQHTIKYTLPKVDDNGNCKINGAIKRMAMQRVNTPICKVSPSRVSLSSNYNKTIVERNESFSNSFIKYIKKIILKADGAIKVDAGNNVYDDITLPYEYSALAKSYNSLSGVDFNWKFIHANRFEGTEGLEELEKTYGVYFGTIKDAPCFINLDGMVSIVEPDKEVIRSSIVNILDTLLVDVKFPSFHEWVNFNVLNKKLPVIFVLAYRFGLDTMLSYLNVKYTKHGVTERINTKPSDIIIKFADVKLVFTSLTTVNRLLIGGLSNFKLEDIEFKMMDEKDAYYDLMISKNLSINYLRGIDDVFEMFIDPITEDVLRQMGEPTNMRDLLIRATVLVSTDDHYEAASSINFRYRSYERFNAIAYKHLARALSTYNNKSVGHKSKFSISEYDIMTAISTDPLMENIDVLNPIGDIKSRHRYSHIGDGGRTKDSLVIKDRRYPDDGIGIMSEATVDSGKVGIEGVLSSNPSIVNIRGMCELKKIDDITPTQLLSPTTLLVPGADYDDSKRRFVRL